jgi:hypothetical protein
MGQLARLIRPVQKRGGQQFSVFPLLETPLANRSPRRHLGSSGLRFALPGNASTGSADLSSPEPGGNNSRYFRSWNDVGESESSKASGEGRAPLSATNSSYTYGQCAVTRNAPAKTRRQNSPASRARFGTCSRTGASRLSRPRPVEEPKNDVTPDQKARQGPTRTPRRRTGLKSQNLGAATGMSLGGAEFPIGGNPR